ncbi:MAG TPA: transporter substrate-binding domain-containing protein [Anaerolineae bacterium]
MSASKRRVSLLMSLLVLVSLLLSACQQATANDLLAEIKARGTIRISTDLNYAPQSAAVQGAARAANTKCGADEITAKEVEGFDIDTANEIARRLGVEPCFVTPSWDLITAGNWGGRWDISVGSMTITKDRQKALWFSPAYYFAPAQLAARIGSGIKSVSDVAGKAVCVGAATTYETYLKGEDVGIPDSDIKVPAPKGATVVPLPTDSECAQAIQAGRTEFDAFLTTKAVIDKAIAQNIKVEKVGDPVYIENLAVAIDKKAAKDTKSLLDEIGKAITAMHSDGTLTKSSQKWYDGVDLSVVK